jgi:hypothetical protein
VHAFTEKLGAGPSNVPVTYVVATEDPGSAAFFEGDSHIRSATLAGGYVNRLLVSPCTKGTMD